MALNKLVGFGLATLGIALAFGCSGAAKGGGSGDPGVGGAPGSGASPGSGGGLNLGGSGGAGAGSGGTFVCDPSKPDADSDGFPAGADCNDCDPNANPQAYDVAGNGVDEDCDTQIDNPPVGCDTAITQVEDNDPMHAAFAIGLCQVSDGTKWGVLEAKYVQADGAPMPPINDLSHGLLPDFGPNVHTQEGGRMLALSSGTARRPSDAGYQNVDGYDTLVYGNAPAGYPINSPSCAVQTASDKKTWNPVALEIKVKAPSNAKSFKFLFDFYTYEFPDYVCTVYNDFFVALQNPAPTNALQGNISFDSQGNPVSVNNGFLDVCDPAVGGTSPGGKMFPCTLGPSQLQGTGFQGGSDPFGLDPAHAATGWLETKSPVVPGSEFTLRFAIWDMGDPILDSTVLIDKFEFSSDPATGSNTTPVPTPR